MGWWLPLTTLVIGIVGGVFIARSSDRDRRKATDLQLQLDSLNTELNEYRNRVTRHFARTAELVDALAANSREIYRHLAEGSEKLCDTDAVKLGQFDDKLGLGDQKTQTAESVTAVEPSEPPKPDDGWYEILPETDEPRSDAEKPEKRKVEEPAL
jgi:uncharacterized membrane-anchored protein YhcB (DUF1043 family)